MAENTLATARRVATLEDRIDRAWSRLREAAALLTSIDLGELLSDAPDDDAARLRHAAGVSLLAILQRELSEVTADLAL